MFGAFPFGAPYFAQAPFSYGPVALPEPHVIGAFASYAPVVSGFASYSDTVSGFASHADTVDAFAEQGED